MSSFSSSCVRCLRFVWQFQNVRRIAYKMYTKSVVQLQNIEMYHIKLFYYIYCLENL